MDQAHAAEIFRALSVPNRMRILMLLKTQGSLPVKAIAETLKMTSPAVSQHLKVLRQAGLVQSERQGYFVPYAINAPALNDCCGMLVHMCAHPHHGSHSGDCACGSETDRLIHRRESLLDELHRVESELERLRGRKA